MFVTGPSFSPSYHGMTIPYEEAIERALTIVPFDKVRPRAAGCWL